MLDTEKLHFKIGISGTYWKKLPAFTISVDDTEIVEPTNISNVVEYFEFDYELVEGQHELKIRLVNKEDSDVVKDDYTDPNNFKIVNDMLLNIVSVEIDEVDLGHLIFTHSKFVPDDESRGTSVNCINLGHNGTWILPFESPFYIWLLETI